jgi:hypothetical protein
MFCIIPIILLIIIRRVKRMKKLMMRMMGMMQVQRMVIQTMSMILKKKQWIRKRRRLK